MPYAEILTYQFCQLSTITCCWVGALHLCYGSSGVGWFRDQSWSKSIVNFGGVPPDSTLQGTITSFSWRKRKNHLLKSAFLRGRIVSLVSWRVVHCFGPEISWPLVICIYLWPFESLRCQGLSRGGTCACGLRKGLVSGCRLWEGMWVWAQGWSECIGSWSCFLFWYWKGSVCCVFLFVQEVQVVISFGSTVCWSFVVA